MRKLIILLLFLISLLSFDTISYASVNDYNSFSRINVSDGKLLRDYTDEELNDAMKYVSKRRFVGWRVYYFNKNVECEFIAKTIYSNFNTGTTPLKYSIEVSTENAVKTSISATGSIEATVKGGIKKFSGSLTNELKLSGSYEETSLVKQKEKLDIEIDPNTMCVIYIMGRGILTNGVAKYYTWWLTDEAGGFEYFTITDSYVRVEKVAL